MIPLGRVKYYEDTGRGPMLLCRFRAVEKLLKIRIAILIRIAKVVKLLGIEFVFCFPCVGHTIVVGVGGSGVRAIRGPTTDIGL